MSATVDALKSDVLPPASLTAFDLAAIQSHSFPSSEPLEPESAATAGGSSFLDVDPQILEALKSKDRLYVLKLGEQMESLINDHRHVSIISSFPITLRFCTPSGDVLPFTLTVPFGE